MPNFLPRQKYPFEQRYQVLDSVTYFRGRHTLKGGFDLNFVREELQNLFQGGGVYSYSGLTTIAQDCPQGATGCVPVADATTSRHYSNYNQAFDLNGLNGLLNFSNSTYAFYAQDTWKPTNRLVLNFGLRYEYQQLPQPGEIQTEGVTFNGNPRFPETMSFHQDKNNWAPRIGMTYDFGGDHFNGAARRVRHLPRSHQQQRRGERHPEQRHQPGEFLLHAGHGGRAGVSERAALDTDHRGKPARPELLCVRPGAAGSAIVRPVDRTRRCRPA